MQQLKIIVEKHPEGYVAYPLGLKGIVIGEGNTYEEALSDVKSAIRFHIDTFGKDIFDNDEILETFIAEGSLGKLRVRSSHLTLLGKLRGQVFTFDTSVSNLSMILSTLSLIFLSFEIFPSNLLAAWETAV